MDFAGRTEQLNRNALKDYLSGLKSPCYETDLMRATFGLKTIPSDALELYQLHFALFHTLYSLQKEYATEGFYLHIHFMRTFLLPYPRKGYCRHYDPEGFFCRTETEGTYCDFHSKPEDELALDDVSAKYFYLDSENYDAISGEQAESFISGAWELMNSWDKAEEARAVLGLPQGFDGKMLRNKFKKLAKAHHPDMNGGLTVDREDEFIKINNAYCFLKNLQGYKL
ncbi:MAG: DnaJ domain-containing protein [Spirochaetales bacterium]|nr:DnaJ domain-containing protein [Spirochaetales bacterium]